MTDLRPYPSYREVDSRWLKSLPDDWEAIRLRYLADITTGSGDTQDAVPEGAYPFIVRSETPLWSSDYSFDTEAILTAGDGAVGEVFHHLTGKFHAHQRVYVLSNFRHVDPRFLYYYFSEHFRLMAQDGSARTTVDSVRRWMLTDMPVAVPPPNEQRWIADFLDAETAQIDALIAEQERFIALLQERRMAVVERVAWSGLGPQVAVSNSRVDTAGPSPDHWKRLRNKDLFREVVDLSVDGTGELLTVSHITGVTPRSMKNVNMFEAETLEGYKGVLIGDLAINTMWAWMGALGVSPYEGLVSPAYGVYRPIRGLPYEPRYFDFLYRTSAYITEMTRHSRGITSSRLRLYPESFLRLPIILPPVEEQRAIADYLNLQTARIDTAVNEAQHNIALSKERRSALITAAVTGQIDVATGRAA